MYIDLKIFMTVFVYIHNLITDKREVHLICLKFNLETHESYNRQVQKGCHSLFELNTMDLYAHFLPHWNVHQSRQHGEAQCGFW